MSAQHSHPQAGFRRPAGRNGHRVGLRAGSCIASLISASMLLVGVSGNPVSAATGAAAAPLTSTAEQPARFDTIFGSAARPASDARHRSPSVELGLRFSARADGVIVGLRVYRPHGRTDAQSATLWTSSGTRLAGLTIPASAQAGWLSVGLRTPVAVQRDTVYVASYHAADGHVSDPNYFSSGTPSRGLVHPAMTDGVVDPHNGVFRYGGSTAYPKQSYRSTNYWVDVAFVATAALPTPPTTTTSFTSPTPSCFSCPPPTPTTTPTVTVTPTLTTAP